MRYLLLAAAFAGFTGMAQAQAQTQAQDPSDDRIKELALEAILENPEIIMQAVEILRQREQQAAAAQASVVRRQLEMDANAPNMGNPDGDVTIVEFFDYNCGYCRRAAQALRTVLDQDPNVRVIMQEWPVLGEGSVYAARAALAARAQDKYDDFHWALMNNSGRLNEAAIMKIARDVGLDTARLQADMQLPMVDAHIAKADVMAKTLGFTGTPGFIIGDAAAPGFISADQMMALIAEARGS